MCEHLSERFCPARKLQRQGLKWGDTPQVAIMESVWTGFSGGTGLGGFSEGSCLWVIVGTKEDNWCSLCLRCFLLVLASGSPHHPYKISQQVEPWW